MYLFSNIKYSYHNRYSYHLIEKNNKVRNSRIFHTIKRNIKADISIKTVEKLEFSCEKLYFTCFQLVKSISVEVWRGIGHIDGRNRG